MQRAYNNAPAGDKGRALYVLGHVPVPWYDEAGSFDGHIAHVGALASDMLYADVDGTYTDLLQRDGVRFG